MLPVTIFTAMTNDCQANAPSLVNRITSCLFSFVVEFANNGFNLGGGGGGEKNSSTKNTKSSLLVPSLYIQAQQRLLWRVKIYRLDLQS